MFNEKKAVKKNGIQVKSFSLLHDLDFWNFGLLEQSPTFSAGFLSCLGCYSTEQLHDLNPYSRFTLRSPGYHDRDLSVLLMIVIKLSVDPKRKKSEALGHVTKYSTTNIVQSCMMSESTNRWMNVDHETLLPYPGIRFGSISSFFTSSDFSLFIFPKLGNHGAQSIHYLDGITCMWQTFCSNEGEYQWGSRQVVWDGI